MRTLTYERLRSEYEGFRCKAGGLKRLIFANRWRKQLQNTEFTIISNNCWGGIIYESYNLPKQSPTVGLFFIAEDYIKFLSDLKGYFATELTFIKPEESKWKDVPLLSENKQFGSYPIGKLNDIEIFFLHYDSEQEAESKWKYRIDRINWDRMLVKFNDQNCCTENDVRNFTKLPFKNKLFFTCKEWPGIGGEHIVIRQLFRHDHIMTSYEPFGKNKYVDITKMINNL